MVNKLDVFCFCSSNIGFDFLSSSEYRYGVHFHVESAVPCVLDEVARKDLAKDIYLPAPNKYIPYSLKTAGEATTAPDREVVPAACTHQLNLPALLEAHARGQLFFTRDKLFGHPRSALFLLLGLHNASRGGDGQLVVTPYQAQQQQLNRITTKFYSRLHAVARYPSAVAGLHHSVTWWKK